MKLSISQYCLPFDFRKELSLAFISIDQFFDLMSFTSRTSVALTEVFSAPVRYLLADTNTNSKVTAAIPKQLNFAYRSNNSFGKKKNSSINLL